MADEVDFTAQPPALGADIARVDAKGLPTEYTLDQEAAQQAFYDRTFVDLQTKITTVQSSTDQVAASVTSEISARTSADMALASDLNTVTTTLADNTASLEVLQQSYNGIAVSYSVTGTINGDSGGFILTGVAKNDGTASYGIEFSVSDFRITDPNYNGGMSGNVLAYSTTLGGFVFGVPIYAQNSNIAPRAVLDPIYLPAQSDTIFNVGNSQPWEQTAATFTTEANCEITVTTDWPLDWTRAGLSNHVYSVEVWINGTNTGKIHDYIFNTVQASPTHFGHNIADPVNSAAWRPQASTRFFLPPGTYSIDLRVTLTAGAVNIRAGAVTFYTILKRTGGA